MRLVCLVLLVAIVAVVVIVVEVVHSHGADVARSAARGAGRVVAHVIVVDAIGDGVLRTRVAVQSRASEGFILAKSLELDLSAAARSDGPRGAGQVVVPPQLGLGAAAAYVQHDQADLAQRAEQRECVQGLVGTADHHAVVGRPVRAAAAVTQGAVHIPGQQNVADGPDEEDGDVEDQVEQRREESTAVKDAGQGERDERKEGCKQDLESSYNKKPVSIGTFFVSRRSGFGCTYDDERPG